MTQEQIDDVVLEGFVEHVDDECHDVAFQVLVSGNLEKYKRVAAMRFVARISWIFKPARAKFQRRLS